MYDFDFLSLFSTLLVLMPRSEFVESVLRVKTLRLSIVSVPNISIWWFLYETVIFWPPVGTLENVTTPLSSIYLEYPYSKLTNASITEFPDWSNTLNVNIFCTVTFTLKYPQYGCINIYFSLLSPQYRGAVPI